MRVILGTMLGLTSLMGSARGEVPRQQEADGYTRYELLVPSSHKFRISYEVTATTPGTRPPPTGPPDPGASGPLSRLRIGPRPRPAG